MNKTEAKKFVYRSISASCRKWATKVTMGDIGPKARQKDVAKVKEALLETADMYDRKLGAEVAPPTLPKHFEGELQGAVETGSPGAEDGTDDVPEIRDQTRFGKEASPASVDKQ